MNVRRQHALVGTGVLLVVLLSIWTFVRMVGNDPPAENPPSNLSSTVAAASSDASLVSEVTGEQVELLDLWRQDDFVQEHLEEVADRSQLPPPCVSFGTVRWADGSPVADARIETLLTRRHGASGTSWEHTGVRTDAAGNYELPAQDICPLRLAASTTSPPPGRGEEYGPPGEGEIPHRIRRDLTVEPVCVVDGEILDSDGEPLDGRVAANPNHWLVGRLHGFKSNDSQGGDWRERKGRFWAYVAYTDDEGFFAFDTLPDGDWTLMAEVEGYEPGLVELSFEDGDCPEPVSFSLESMSCWTVAVFDPEGNPIPNAEVWAISIIRSRLGWTAETVPTGPDGRAQICEITARGSGVEACGPGFTCVSEKNYEGSDYVEITVYPAGGVVAVIDPPPPDGIGCSVGAGVDGPANNYADLYCEIRDGVLRAEPVPAGDVRLGITITGFEKVRKEARIHQGGVTDLGVIRPITDADYEDWREGRSVWRLR